MERYDQLEEVWLALASLNSVDEIAAYMEEHHGDHEAYAGYFSRVYKSITGGDYVLKISIEPDDGWVAFAKSVIRRNSSNPLIPSIPKRYFRMLPDGRAVAFIEQLNIDQDKNITAFDDVIENVVLQAPAYVMALDKDTTPFDEAFEEYKNNLQPIFMEEICYVFDISMSHLEDFFNFITSIFNTGLVYLLDVNIQNIGYRSNGDPVFYDPLSFKVAT
jgi:hypothetical protein